MVKHKEASLWHREASYWTLMASFILIYNKTQSSKSQKDHRWRKSITKYPLIYLTKEHKGKCLRISSETESNISSKHKLFNHLVCFLNLVHTCRNNSCIRKIQKNCMIVHKEKMKSNDRK